MSALGAICSVKCMLYTVSQPKEKNGYARVGHRLSFKSQCHMWRGTAAAATPHAARNLTPWCQGGYSTVDICTPSPVCMLQSATLCSSGCATHAMAASSWRALTLGSSTSCPPTRCRTCTLGATRRQASPCSPAPPRVTRCASAAACTGSHDPAVRTPKAPCLAISTCPCKRNAML